MLESFYLFSVILKGQKVTSPGIKCTSCSSDYNLGFYTVGLYVGFNISEEHAMSIFREEGKRLHC
jgi:hypothetical protein